MLTLSFNRNNDWILRVFQTTLNLTFPLAKETNLLIKYALYFSFFEENGKRIVTCFLLSNNHGGIRSSSFFRLKFLIVFSITCFGYPASVNLLLIFFVSSSKFEAILLALRSSPVIAFLLYLKGTFKDQCTGRELSKTNANSNYDVVTINYVMIILIILRIPSILLSLLCE